MKKEILKRNCGFFLIVVMLVFAMGSLLHGWLIIKGDDYRFDVFNQLPKISVGMIQSDSMSPVIKKGDLVLIKEEKTYETGDIVLIKDAKGRSIIHRLVIYNTYANIILTKGDANDSFDEPLTCDAIQGKLWFSIPKVGKIFMIGKWPKIGAIYRSASSVDFCMQVASSEPKETDFSIDEIDVWME